MEFLEPLFAYVKAILADPAVGGVIAGLVILAIGDLVTGIGAAIREHAFEASLVATWVETHVLGRVLPIILCVLLGTQNLGMAAIAAASAGLYAVETLASIRRHLSLPDESAA